MLFFSPPEGTAPTAFRSMGVALPRERRPKVRLSLPPSLEPAKNPNPPLVLLEGGPWRGAEDSNCFARLLLHIRRQVYVSCSTQYPGTPTWGGECGNVHY